MVGAVGYTAYVIGSKQQFNAGTMLVAAGGGAAAGALIGTGVGWAAGVGVAETTAAAVTTAGIIGTTDLAVSGEAQEVIQTAQEEIPTVYRGLAETENAANGLWARAVDAGNSAVSHVAGKINTQWISTSKDLETTMDKWGKNGVAEINLSKVGSEIVDFSKGIPGMEGTMLSNWAQKYQEVLIKNYIPPEAIVRIITGKE